MNIQKLKEALIRMQRRIKEAPKLAEEAMRERKERIAYYQSFTAARIQSMREEDFCEYIGKLWSTIMWGNKTYYVGKIITENGFEKTKQSLIKLLYGAEDISSRWNIFQKEIKGIGPATMSELLSYSKPNEYIIFNTSTVRALSYLEVKNLPKYNYQYTGEKFLEACHYGNQIARLMEKEGFEDVSLLAVDYLMWDELPPKGGSVKEISASKLGQKEETTIHEEIKRKLVEIGQFLGFDSRAEIKIATGAIVDVIWAVKIGNMGRALYVFEVQSHGSIDSMILNLIKAQAHPAVQAVVAVASTAQLEKVKGEFPEHAIDKNKLKLWDFDDVMQVHDLLGQALSSIGKLSLVPESFF